MILQGRIHLDRRHEPTAKLRSKTKIVPEGEAAAHLGLRRLQHQPGAGLQLRLRAQAGLRLPRPDPRRQEQARPLRGAAHRHDAAPEQHARGLRDGQEVRDARHLVRHRAGVHLLRGLEAPRLARQRLPGPQGPYYCGVGADEVFGREIVEAHTDACLVAGLSISGINGEVMPGQWEFQIGPVGPPAIGRPPVDGPLAALPHRRGLRRQRHARPQAGQGRLERRRRHTNFSTKAMRASYEACIAAAEALGKKHALHIANYGYGIEDRLTGQHETASYKEFRYGVRDRGASVRIPWQVAATRRATSRTAARTPTWTRTSSRG